MLTATVNGGEDQLLEVDLMKVFKIRTYDHSKGQYEPDEMKWKPLNITTPDQYKNYFIERRKTQAILIYTSPTQKKLL